MSEIKLFLKGDSFLKIICNFFLIIAGAELNQEAIIQTSSKLIVIFKEQSKVCNLGGQDFYNGQVIL